MNSIYSAESTWESSPSFFDFYFGTKKFLHDNIEYLRVNYTFPDDLRDDFYKCYNNLSDNVLPIIILLSIGWTICRRLFTDHLFKPLAVYYQLPNEEREKLPESAWKFLFYSISWIFVACIILFNNDCRYFHKPSLIWKGESCNQTDTLIHCVYIDQADYSMSTEIPNDVYTIFVVQLSFYIHSVYATIYVDAWRKDSLVLIGHHIITSVMLLFSLSTRCHRAGLGTIFLHDMCDILLEGTKTSLYFKKQANKCYPIFEMIANIGFACFSFTWFIARLYWFPLRVLYNTSVYLNEHNIKVPFTFFINCLLYILLSMNIYWFAFILNLLYKVIGGQIVEDVRDFDDAEQREESVSNDVQHSTSTLMAKESDRSQYFLRQRKDVSISRSQ